jgi:ribosomal protein L35
MPKLKTKKTAIKRIKVTKSGKLIRKQVRTGHLKRKWTTNKRHRKTGLKTVPNAGHKKIFKKLLNKYGKAIK